MVVKIYHNPLCSKSRQSLEIIKNKGIEPKVIEYLNTPPSAGELKALLERMDMTDPRALMRKGEDTYKALDLANANKDRDALIKAMVENPILIERPIVVTNKGVRLGRPPENIKDVL